MKRIFTILLLLFCAHILYGQSACPNVTVNPTNVSICSGCTTLTATVQGSVATTSYGVSNIPYTPFSYNTGTPVLIGVDDQWSSVINLPFCFQFFGNTYNQCIIGSNGCIGFNIANASTVNTWPIGAAIPTATVPDMLNTIMGPWHDIDPSVGGAQYYQLQGTAPCRRLVVSWYQVPMFFLVCNSMLATHQIVLYETTNIIDIYIQNSPLCIFWNNGAAIEGIQNSTGTLAYTVPGRNYPTQWSATNDAWRFTPTGAPQYTLTWYNGATPIGNNLSVTVCPNTTTTYTAQLVNNTCSGPITLSAQSTVTVAPAFTLSTSSTPASCGGNNGSATVSITSGGSPPFTYSWNTSPPQNTQTASGLPSGNYTVTVTNSSGCSVTATVTVTSATGPTASIPTHTNVLCNGGSTGSATVAVTGGAPPYTYVWSPSGGNGPTANNLSAGNYTVTVTDANGCTTTAVVTITQPPPITLTPSSVQATCGQSNGSASVTASGGTPGYNYLWNSSPLQTTQTASGLPAGNYTVIVTDAHGCTATVTVTVGNATGPSASIPTHTNVLCNGGSTGSATVVATGGAPPYTYVWSPSGGNGPTANNLSAGNYTVTVTDANGCTTTAVVTITQPPPITLTPSSVQATCGQSNGSASVTASGGTPGYNYSWNTTPVQTTQTASGLPSGNYTVTVTDANGCTVTAVITVGSATGPNATISAQTNVLCNGGNTGSATVSVTGGTPSYTYAWSSGGNSATTNNLSAGSYTVTVTDANGCTTTAVVTITQPPPITLTPSSVQATCGQSIGSASVTTSGGTPGYSYSWNTTPVQTTQTASGLPSGNYTVTVTDANGCTATAAITVGSATGPTATISAQTNVLCNAGNTGSATVSVTGGTPSYTYAWSSGGNAATENNLSASSYTVTVTDANGCTTTAVVTITQPPPITLTPSSVQATCGQSNGSASVTTSGGTPGYSYSWNTTPVQTTQTASGLPSGNYTVTVTDANGCTATAAITVGSATGPTATISVQTNVLCNAGNTGSATVVVTGGSSPYTYVWSPSGGNGPTANNLSAGSYTVTVTDANGCTTTAVVTITQPPPITLTPSSVQATCGQSNGSASVTASGGTPGYSYSWNTTPVQTTQTASGLPSGNYTVTVTDANGCTATAGITVGSATGPTATISAQTNVLCNAGNTGSATVSVTGGTPSYTYTWSSGGNTTTENNLSAGSYTVTVTDANGCTTTAVVTITQPPPITLIPTSVQATCGQSNGSSSVTASGGTPGYSYSWNTTPVQTTQTASGLPSGNYTVTVTDANGCTVTAVITVGSATGPNATISAQTNVLCNGDNTGSATVSVTGGTPSYTYAWSSGGNSSTANNLSAGSYTVTVTDANGCTTTAVVTITQPPPITLTPSSVQATCGQSNGSASVTASGGTPGYSYSWNTTPVQTTQTASGLPSGNYTVIVTDANGCTSTAAITVGSATGPTATISAQTNVLCNAGNTGSATVSVTGGTPSYTYAWSSGGNSSTANNLSAGSYTVTVTDANGCTTTAVVTITQPPPITLTPSSVQATCGQSNGSASVTASGGTPSYTYSWNTIPVQTTQTANGLPSGNYTVTVTDANGCTATTAITVGSATGPTATISAQTNVLCNAGSTGSATVSVTGGTPSYTYAWSSGGNATTENNLSAGSYTVTVTDANGCTTTAVVTITQPPPITLTPSSVQATCGQSNGSASVTASGGTPGYSYSWNTTPVQTTQTATGLPSGNYTVTVTDANGCTATAAITVGSATGPTATISAQTNVLCNGGNTGSATVSVTGGTPSYTYAWSSGGNSSTANNLSAGSYTVTVTDANGCTTTAVVTITQPPPITLTPSSVQATCGQSNGSASVTASGGTPGYSYSWNTTPVQTTQTATGLPSGNYTVTVTDANGCTATAAITVGSATGPTATISAQTNVLCNAGNTGSATVSVTGGTPSYTYAWSSGGNSATANNLSAGSYTVTVTDANGCTTTAVVTITQPPPITLTPSSVQATCGQSNGSASVTASGGTPGYSYSWNTTPVQTTQTASGLPSGNYTVTVTDANGCTATAAITVGSATGPTATISAQTNVLCNAGSTGSATVSVTGGTPSYTYAWSSGGNATTENNLSAGSYTVTVTDANGCTTTAGVTITQPPPITLIPTSVQATCGQSNGSASVTASGGTPGYSYSWNTTPVQTTQTVSGLPSGNYTVTVTDANGCTATAAITVGSATGPTATISAQTNVLCNGGNTGSATVSVTGGTPSYTYAWSSGGSAITEINLSAGSYTVTVTDANGCTTTAVVTITQPPPITLTPSSVQATCGQSNGSASVTASGGTPGYSYSWNTTPVQTTQTASGLPSGNYIVTVTDANGCTATVTSVVGNANGPTATIATQVDVLCNGGNNGSATVNVTGGSPSYTYVWSSGGNAATENNLSASSYTVNVSDANGCTTTAVVTIAQPPPITLTPSSIQATCGQSNGSASVTASGGTPGYSYSWNTTPVQTTQTASGLPSGNYTVAVTDANGCTATVTAVVGNANGPTATIATQVDVLCNGGNTGSATVNVTGGSPSYTYAWSSGGNAATENNLSASSYTVTVSDANGCTTTAVVTIAQPPPITLTPSSVQATCGQSNGSASVTASGGTPSYSYSWNTTPVQTTQTASGLPSGNYTVTVTDANGCTTTASAVVVNANGPTATIATQVDVLCNGGNTGSATVNVTGGSPSYTYAWSSGGNAATENNLSASSYTVTVTDANGCTTTAVVTITQPPPITLTPTSVQATCGQSNGLASVVANGGVPPYSYSWNTTPVQTTQSAAGIPSGNYTVIVTDANGCTASTSVNVTNANGPSATITAQADVLCNGGNNGSATVTAGAGMPPYSYVWSSGGNAATESNLSAGNYTVTVTDANGCIAIATTVIAEPAALLISPATITSVSCNGGNNGSASVAVSGGTSPYSYAWSSGGNAAAELNLTAGNYSVNVTDANGCTVSSTVTITQPPALVLVTSPSDTICYGTGTILTATPAGGTQPYSYYWSTGANSQSINVSITTTTVYTITVTDNNNCSITSQPITLTVNPPLNIVMTGNASICDGASATISAAASGGDGNYSFTWNPSPGNGSGPYVVTPNITTVYILTLTDGCGTLPVSDSVTIVVNSLPVVQFNASDMTGCAPLSVCFSDLSAVTNGSVSSWSWNFGDNTASSSTNPCHSYSTPGTYTVTLSVVTNAGCSATLIQNNYITVAPSVVASFTASPQTTTVDAPLVSFTDNSLGATLWQWDFGDGSAGSNAENPSHTFNNMGHYEICLTASNLYGCSDTACTPVIVDMDFVIYIPNVFTPNHDGANDVFTASGIGIKQFEMFIYDRWGLKIFHTNDIQKGWDGILKNGEPALMDVYTYLIYATDFHDVRHPYIGSVSIVR